MHKLLCFTTVTPNPFFSWFSINGYTAMFTLIFIHALKEGFEPTTLRLTIWSSTNWATSTWPRTLSCTILPKRCNHERCVQHSWSYSRDRGTDRIRTGNLLRDREATFSHICCGTIHSLSPYNRVIAWYIVQGAWRISKSRPPGSHPGALPLSYRQRYKDIQYILPKQRHSG